MVGGGDSCRVGTIERGERAMGESCCWWGHSGCGVGVGRQGRIGRPHCLPVSASAAEEKQAKVVLVCGMHPMETESLWLPPAFSVSFFAEFSGCRAQTTLTLTPPRPGLCGPCQICIHRCERGSVCQQLATFPL